MTNNLNRFTTLNSESWLRVLEDELQQPYILELAKFVAEERKGNIPVYPPSNLVFNALLSTPFEKVKVVIVGQDPYHGPRQAHGLSFSVQPDVPFPRSLRNIFLELQQDVGFVTPSHGCLASWADQGVLLLNATLTVREGQPMSHHGKGWERFTDAILKKLCDREDPVIFVLWGKSAQEKCRHILTPMQMQRHYLLTAAHPSPFSADRGFFGCRHFSKINEWLLQHQKIPINWQI